LNERRDGHGVGWIIWQNVGTDVLKDGGRNILVALKDVLS